MNLQQFKDKYLGKQVEYHSYSAGAENQCVDLANQYIVEVLGLTPIIGTNAKDFKDRFNNDEFDWIPNTPDAIIRKGDIPVWNGRVGGGAGHIAIALADGTLTSFTSLDQNWSKKELVTVETHNYSNVSGWLRPKGKSMSSELDVCMKDRQKFWDERDDLLRALNAGSVEEGKSTIAGYKSRNTDLANQVGTLQAEVDNRKQQVSRVEAQLLSKSDEIKFLDTQLQKARQDAETYAREKGLQAIETEKLRAQLETLRQQQQQGEVTITFADLWKLIWNQKIVIRR